MGLLNLFSKKIFYFHIFSVPFMAACGRPFACSERSRLANAAWRVAISNRFIAGADSDEVFMMLDGTAGWPVEFFRIGIAEVAGFWNGGCT